MMKKVLLTALVSAFGLSATATAAELNIYSARHYQTDEQLYGNFTKQTGIKINRIEAKEDELLERIREIICDQLDLEEDKVTMDSDIMEDFEADSLDVVDLVMSIEDEFGLEVPDDQIENFRTVGDVVRYIEENS